jgi:excisionase family DNA binding protein
MKYHTVSEVAEKLGVSRQAVISRIGKTIKAAKIGRQWVIDEEELRKLTDRKYAED